MTESTLATQAVSDPPPLGPVSGIPFAYAQNRNVLLERTGGALILYYVAPLAPEVLLEVRRYTGEVFSLEALDEAAFRQRLTVSYQRTQNEAAQMADDLSSDIDL